MSMLHPPVLCEEHFGKPVLKEAAPIELARVPVNGDRLQDSIILHPRYIPRGVDHELFSARVYRRGRTVDLFLDEPVEIGGEEYGILNFKGVGANADQEMVIDLDEWYHCSWRWIPRADGDEHGRVWGALTQERGQEELAAEIFHTNGIKHAPHVALNPIPSRVTEAIRQVHHRSQTHDLTQLVRACKTNVRVDQYSRHNQGRQYHDRTERWWIERIAEIDAALINAEVTLAEKGETLYFVGSFNENRFIDGLFTDAENYGLREFRPFHAGLFIEGAMYSSTFALIPCGQWRSYYRYLEEKTGLPFTDPSFSKRISRYLNDVFTGRGEKK